MEAAYTSHWSNITPKPALFHKESPITGCEQSHRLTICAICHCSNLNPAQYKSYTKSAAGKKEKDQYFVNLFSMGALWSNKAISMFSSFQLFGGPTLLSAPLLHSQEHTLLPTWWHYIRHFLLSELVNPSQSFSQDTKPTRSHKTIYRQYTTLQLRHLNGVTGVRRFIKWSMLTRLTIQIDSWLHYWCDGVSLRGRCWHGCHRR